MADKVTRDPNGTIQAFTAARDGLELVSPKYRQQALFAVVRRLLDLAQNSPGAVGVEAMQAAIARADSAEKRLASIAATLGQGISPAPTRKRQAKPTEEATPKATSTTGKRHGRPKGSKNKPKDAAASTNGTDHQPSIFEDPQQPAAAAQA